MNTYAHIQISREANALVYVVPSNEVCNLLDELVANGVDISHSFLLKTTN